MFNIFCFVFFHINKWIYLNIIDGKNRNYTQLIYTIILEEWGIERGLGFQIQFISKHYFFLVFY